MKLSGDFDLITSSVLHCPRNTPMGNKVGTIAYEMAAMVLLEEWNIVVVFFQENKVKESTSHNLFYLRFSCL